MSSHFSSWNFQAYRMYTVFDGERTGLEQERERESIQTATTSHKWKKEQEGAHISYRKNLSRKRGGWLHRMPTKSTERPSLSDWVPD